jgi:hypothetical protein
MPLAIVGFGRSSRAVAASQVMLAIGLSLLVLLWAPEWIDIIPAYGPLAALAWVLAVAYSEGYSFLMRKAD